MYLPTLFDSSPTMLDFSSLLDSLWSLEPTKHSKLTHMLAIDIEEEKEQYRVLLDVPGLNKEDIDISLDNTLLTINVSKQCPPKEKKFILQERSKLNSTRTIRLPKDIKADSVNASLINGILNITVDKVPKELAKKVTIN